MKNIMFLITSLGIYAINICGCALPQPYDKTLCVAFEKEGSGAERLLVGRTLFEILKSFEGPIKVEWGRSAMPNPEIVDVTISSRFVDQIGLLKQEYSITVDLEVDLAWALSGGSGHFQGVVNIRSVLESMPDDLLDSMIVKVWGVRRSRLISESDKSRLRQPVLKKMPASKYLKNFDINSPIIHPKSELENKTLGEVVNWVKEGSNGLEIYSKKLDIAFCKGGRLLEHVQVEIEWDHA
jgi:hypothetical protein